MPFNQIVFSHVEKSAAKTDAFEDVFVYTHPMTQLLERAFQTLRGLPPEMQDDLARMVLQVVGEEQPVYPLSAEEKAALDVSFAEAQRGEFATDAEIDAIWAQLDE